MFCRTRTGGPGGPPYLALLSLTLRARTMLAEMLIGINASVVPIIPKYPDSVASDNLSVRDLGRGLVHHKRIGRTSPGLLGGSAMGVAASCARTVIAKI